jgi:Tol biopolymer transport system component
MPMTPGEKRGPYEIIEPIGKGGMGEVYRALDTRVGRDVAIKVSTERFGERFEREAQTIAALNHPNICTLFDVGPDYLVMELVEGESPKGPLPLETALDYARQIAAALEAAHDRGIVHRDLKPANIKVTPQGQVKILDFGLAKVASPSGGRPVTETSPTFSMAATQAGMVVGTAAYMSPEQARGQAVDKRADIWAFGVVLYELITGKRLFEGEDLTDTLAAVVREKPDLSTAPAEVRRVLEKCLEKDPKKRLRDISGVQLLLDAGTAVPAEKTDVGRGRFSWATPVAAVALAGLIAMSWLHFRETAPVPPQAVMFTIEPPEDVFFTNQFGGFAVSPDGRYVVMSARLKVGQPWLWLRPVDSLLARQLPGTEGGNFPTWSPDSKSLVFFVDDKLKRLEITGGAPLTLTDAAQSRVTPTGTWNRDGVILYGSAKGLMRVSAAGGGATLVTKVDPAKNEAGHGYPQFLPDGDRFLYFSDSSDVNVAGVYASSLRAPDQRKQIVRTGSKAVYVSPRAGVPGYLLWIQERTLVAQRFDESSFKLDGDPVPVAEEIGINPATPVRAGYWASDAGLLVYLTGQNLSNLLVNWIGRDGKQLEEAAPTGSYREISLAPGAQRMAMSRSDVSARGNFDIWLREFARGVMTRLTFDSADDRLPIWSPDGKEIAFASNRVNGVYQIFKKDASGSGSEEQLTNGANPKVPLSWSRDGNYILYREESPATARDLMALPLTGDRKPIPVVNTKFQEITGAISPDGRWIAYTSNDSGTYQLYVQAFPGGTAAPKGRWQISNDTAFDVKWRGDGKELYYQTFNGNGKVMAAAIQTGPDGVRAETARVLFSADYPNGILGGFDVTSDGQRFLLIQNARSGSATEKLTVITNWQASLRK